MYGNYKRRPYKGKKKKISPTKKAYLAGIRAGKRMARAKRRWHRWR